MKTAAGGFAYLALAVVLGAFVAHSLKSRLDPYSIGVFQTGQQYQVIAAFALILLGLTRQPVKKQALLLLIGSVIFSGSLYALALTGFKMLGAITPIGGVCMIAALLWTAAYLWRVEGQT